MKTCNICKQSKPESEFYKNGNRKHCRCKDCHKEIMKTSYEEKINKVNKLKEEIGCLKCRETRYYILEFHHNDPNEKDYSISNRVRASFETIQKEISKCSVLCCNCHREFHHLNRENGITIEEYLQ